MCEIAKWARWYNFWYVLCIHLVDLTVVGDAQTNVREYKVGEGVQKGLGQIGEIQHV